MKEEQLCQLLEKKRGFFEAILELTSIEKTLPLDQWISVLHQKRALVSCIEEIDEELAGFSESFITLPQEISEELEAIENIIKEIMLLDKAHLEERKGALKKGDLPLLDTRLG